MLRFFVLFFTVSVLAAQGTPSAVVSLSQMADEILAVIAEDHQIKALSTLADDPIYSNVPLEIRKKVGPRCGPSVEQILVLKPDLVLAAEWNRLQDLEILRRRGIPVEILRTPTNWPEILQTVRKVGALLNRSGAAEKWISSVEAQRISLSNKFQRSGQIMKKALEYTAWGTTGTKNSLWQVLLDLAQVENLASEFKGDQWGFAPLSRETLLKVNPEVLVVPTDQLQNLMKDPVIHRLRAYAQNKIFALPEKFKSSTSPFLLKAAQLLFESVYPELGPVEP